MQRAVELEKCSERSLPSTFKQHERTKKLTSEAALDVLVHKKVIVNRSFQANCKVCIRPILDQLTFVRKQITIFDLERT